MSPDPNFHTDEVFDNPAMQIRILAYQIAYARDRVLHGDWTEKYAREAIVTATAATESKLRNSHGCSFVNLYGNLTTGCRALLTWSYVDKDGAKESGQSHPSIQ